jgi:replicative DNA helicase
MTGSGSGLSAAAVSLNNEDSEQMILGGLFLCDPEDIQDVSAQLKPEDFSNHLHGVVYRAIVSQNAKGEQPDWVTTTDEVGRLVPLDTLGGPERIKKLLADITHNVPDNYGMAGHVAIVKDLATRRGLRDVARDAYEQAHDMGVEPSEVAYSVGDSVNSVLDKDVTNDGMTLAADAVLATREKIKKGRGETILTGWSNLDYHTGGWTGGQLIVLGARPAVGKSAAAVNIMTRCVDKRPLLFTLEMTAEEVVTRMVSLRGEVNGRMYANNELPAGQAEVARRVEDQMIQEQFFIDDSPSLSIKQICAKALRMKRRCGVGLVIVDYIGLVRSHLRGETRQLEVADVCHRLKALAREIDAPVIALTQLNRASEHDNRPPRLHDMRESGDIEQDADQVIALHRKDQGSNEDTIDWIVLKNRGGPTGTIPFRFRKQYVLFEEVGDG